MISTTLKILITFSLVKTVSLDHTGPCGPGEEQYFTGNYPAAGWCRPSSGSSSSGSSSCYCSCQGTSGTFHGDWTPCTVSCGHGMQSRRGIRFDSCGNSHNLNPETRPCNQQPCPVNGGWSVWGQFTPCGKSCGGGIQVRFRSCDHPSPSNGGLPCYGNSLQTASCNNKVCPELVTLTNPISIETTTSLPSVNLRSYLNKK